MTHFITVTNQKGGVGKTSISIHIAEFAAKAMKLKTLLVDLDGQRNSTFIATGKNGQDTGLVVDLWDQDATLPTPLQTRFSFDLLVGPTKEQGPEIDKQGQAEAIKALNRLHEMDYDLVVFDTPPAYCPRQVAPMFLGGLLLFPMQPDITAFSGVAETYKVWQAAREKSGIDLLMVINMRILNSGNHTAIIDKMRQTGVGQYILPEELTHRTLLQNALRNGKAVWGLYQSDNFSKTMSRVCKRCITQVLNTNQEVANG